MDGGKTDLINVSVLILVAGFNFINQISLGKSLIDRFYLTIPFLFMICLILIFKSNRIVTAFVFLMVAIGTTIDPSNISDYSGSIFFIYSFHLIKNKYYALFLSLMTVLLLTVRSLSVNDSIPGTLIMILIFAYIYSIYYFLIYKKPKLKRVDLWNKISEKEKGILKLYMKGYDYAKISKTLNINDKKDSIRTSITRCRNESGCDNDIQFGIWLSDNV